MSRRSFAASFLLIVLAGSGRAESPPAQEWPLVIEGARVPIVMYQPQPDTFKDNQLTARAAVSIQPPGKDPVFGAVWLEARISTDRDARTVTVEDVQVPRTRFAGATPEKEQMFSQILAEALTQKHFVISLDRLLVSLENAKRETASAEGLKTDPPKIYVEKSAAVLVLLDGEPQLRPIKESSDQRVVNTAAPLVFTKDNQWQLTLDKRQLRAPDLKGPWKDVLAASTPPPKIIVSQEPAELIVSSGEPVYTPMPGNNLLYMANTESDVFVETATSKIFVLLSGRWFTAASLNGPWTFVRPNQLPAAFATIPPASPKASVRASVAGTDEAEEALVDAQIPQTAVVSRKDKDGKLQITWDGEPKFQEIEGLSVAYSLNSSQPVFRVGKEGYWACADGIWYAAKQPAGPWVVATYVPKEIYAIPPSCPYYNCRYVHIYEAKADVVYVGYYPGYVGSYPYYGTVVYGTGYYYHGWYGPTYHYPPVMITFGFSYHYSPYYGYAGHYPVYGYRPGYGYGRGPHVEHHGDRAQNRGPHASQLPARSGDRGAHASTQPTNRPNNVYADRDGNVSRRTADGTWQDRNGNGWQNQVSPKQDIQRDAQARDRGAQRASQYKSSSAPARSYSGGGARMSGGMRGGGGGGRR